MQDSDRVLTPSEWELFSTGLNLLRDSVEEDIRAQTDDTETGIPVFDRLTPEQRLALLAATAQALRDPATPTPRHTAANEGAIAAVFSMIRVELETELDVAEIEGHEGQSTPIRRLLRAVGGEAKGREEPLPDETATEPDPWGWLLEVFEERIFWDADFAMGDEFLDLPPDEARAQLQLYRIDPDYYLAIPPEPGQRGLIAARQTLARLLHLPVPDDDGRYPALDDLYHDLCVGPVAPGEILAWRDHPWVQIISMPQPEWDCDYPTWQAGFGGAVPSVPFRLDPANLGADPDLPDGMRFERYGEAWVVRDERGLYWCGLIDNGWTDDPNDDPPALAFPTEAEARAAYAQADRMYGERAARHQQAMTRLGWIQGQT
jgi:hypothetical protein